MSDFAKDLIGLSLLEQQEAASRARVEQYGNDLERDNQLKNQQAEINRLRNEANGIAPPSQQEIALRERVAKLEEIESLLNRPMAEIAQKIPAFKDTYLKEQEILAQWILKQKAFAEIAMQYGQALGKTPDQVTTEANEAQELVKDGSSRFGNNLGSETRNFLNYGDNKKEEEARIKQEQNERYQRMVSMRKST
ncbi:hypothetical protein GCM10010975_29940 [Comamonas phosphati]|nr:hypothetical protein GCM10010975_29940 [Comamonas phosphati]